MKITTNNRKSGLTEYFEKSFKKMTAKGNEATIHVFRKKINVTSEPFISDYYYTVTFSDFSTGNLTRKDAIEYYLNFIDDYSHKL